MLGKCISGIWISKILLGEDPDPRVGFATSVLARSGSARHGLPPKQKILAMSLYETDAEHVLFCFIKVQKHVLTFFLFENRFLQPQL